MRDGNLCVIRRAHDYRMKDEMTFECFDCGKQLQREEYVTMKKQQKKKGFFR